MICGWKSVIKLRCFSQLSSVKAEPGKVKDPNESTGPGRLKNPANETIETVVHEENGWNPVKEQDRAQQSTVRTQQDPTKRRRIKRNHWKRRDNPKKSTETTKRWEIPTKRQHSVKKENPTKEQSNRTKQRYKTQLHIVEKQIPTKRVCRFKQRDQKLMIYSQNWSDLNPRSYGEPIFFYHEYSDR